MSQTTSKGYKNPDVGDRGSQWFPDLNFNIDRMNAHAHDGIDSEKIAIKNIVKQSQTLLSSAWGTDLGGSNYKQSVTMPTGLNFDDSQIKFIEVLSGTTGDQIHPTVSKTSATTFDVFVNDNTMTVKVVYG